MVRQSPFHVHVQEDGVISRIFFQQYKINHSVPFPFELPFIFFFLSGVWPSASIFFGEDFSFEAFMDGDFPLSPRISPSPHSSSPWKWGIWC
jgi:hypothetical protein